MKLIKYEIVTDGKLWALKRSIGFWIFKFVSYFGHSYWYSKSDSGFNSYCWTSKEAATEHYHRFTS